MNIKIFTLLCGLVLSASIVAAGDGPRGNRARRGIITVKPRPPTVQPFDWFTWVCDNDPYYKKKYHTCKEYSQYCKTVKHATEDDCWFNPPPPPR